MMRIVMLAAVSLAQSDGTPVRPLPAGGSIRDALAGGESARFSFEVPAQTAARVIVTQEGVDVGLTLRRQGSPLPDRALDFTAGPAGEERLYPGISATESAWDVVVSASLPRASRGEYSISLELAPARDQDRAIAAARVQHYEASQETRGGAGPALERAKAAYAAAAGAALASGDLAQAAESTYQCALTHEVLGEMPDSIEWHRRALDLFRRLGRRDREARVLNRLGDQSRKVGEMAESERYFEQALPIAREARDPVAVVDILNNHGLLRSSLGRFEDAIERLQAAVPLAQEVDATVTELALHCNIAESYRFLGMYHESLETYARALEVARRVGLPRRTGRTLHMLAETYIDMGDLARAGDALREAIALYEQSGDRTGHAVTLALHGRVLHDRGDPDAAVAIFERALPLLRSAQARGGEAGVLRAWAEVDMGRGDGAAALEKLDAALRLDRLTLDPDLEAHTLYLRALALRKERIDEAVASVSQAIAIVEAMRGDMQRSEFRASYLSRVRSYFDLQVDLLQQRGSTAAAFTASERSRARTLLEGLSEGAAKIRKGVDAGLLERQVAVQAQLNGKDLYRARLAQREAESSPRLLAATRDVEGLLQQLREIEAAIRTASPAYWALQRPEPITADHLQRTLLDEDSALVAYHLGRDRGYAWVIDRHSITVHGVPPAAKIDALARRYHGLLSRETRALTPVERETLAREIAAAGQSLAALVWNPIESRVRARRLLLVADGALLYVPFAALPTSAGNPVIAAHEIVSLPSASVLDTLRRDSRAVTPDARAAVFADPVFSKSDPRLAAHRDAAAPAETRAADGGFYGRLRFSRREAEAIAAASPGAFQALDFSASKTTLAARNLRQYRILHFATHGSLNTEHPELSGLVFSLHEPSGKPVDGFLRLHEIYNLDLDADLVVLSACRTALGREVHGEGLIGLTRGFMYAGASRVVSSLWNVDDRASAQLMSRFYAAMLSKRLRPAAALREAQLSLLAEPRWANPHYWAAFGLQGEWR